MNLLKRLFSTQTFAGVRTTVGGLPIPSLLFELVKHKHWPSTPGEAARQNVSPSLISSERVKAIAEEESGIYLYPPPQHTVAELIDLGDTFWNDPMQTPTEISFTQSICIGDFGLGSDAPLILDYRIDMNNPTVRRLKWSTGFGRGENWKSDNHWVIVANSFNEFVNKLDLTSVRFDA